MAALASASTTAVQADDTAVSQMLDSANGAADTLYSDSYERSPAPPREHPGYMVGEKALCYHGPLIYEAKVLQSAHFDTPAPLTKMTGWHYFVHYKGWKRTWDEWVDESRLLKLNEANLAFQKNLMQPASLPVGSNKAANGTGGASASAAGGVTGSKAGGGAGAAASAKAAAGKKDPRGTKRGRDEDDPARKVEMKLVIPEVLKQVMVNDWENVTKHNRLVKVPADHTVYDILLTHSTNLMEKDRVAGLRTHEKQLDSVASGLKTYFDKSLGVNLLYRFERPQYAELQKEYGSIDPSSSSFTGGPSSDMSSLYGAEHLLRMLVSLPAMVAQSSLDKASMETIRDWVNGLLLWLAEDDRDLFSGHQPTGPMYSNVARS